jgi:putative heme-binding domain-containing protein
LKAVSQKKTSESSWWQAASLEGLAQGSEEMAQDRSGLKSFQDPLLALFHSPEPPIRRAALRLLKWTELKGPHVQQTLQETVVRLDDPRQDPQARADAIEFVALAGASASHEASLQKLIDPQQPEPVQAAAVKALGEIPGQQVGIFLLSRWRTLTAPVRNEAARALESNEAGCKLLLDAIRNDTVQSWTLTFRQKSALIMNRNPEIRARAHALLESSAADTEKALKKYQTALDIKGDPIQGEKVFKNVCAKCHKKNGVGADVGPDLGTVQNRPAALILEDILIPSKSIAQKYEAYVVETFASGMHEGVLGVQTPEGITLKAEEGKETQIARHDIKRMYVANLSAMPADLQKQIDVQQMANLLKFLTAR